MFVLLLLLPVVLCVLGIIYCRYKFTYWNSRNIVTFPYPTIPWGHLSNPFSSKTTNLGIHLIEYYQYFKFHKQIHGGIYMSTSPVYIPIDLDLIKRILVKDFHYFDEKGLYYHEEAQPISAHMFQIGGEKWRRIRQKVSPTFTSGKLKGMFPIVLKCTEPMMNFLEKADVIDIKRLTADYTIDVIGNCAFGIETNSFKNPDSDFYKFGRKIFATDTKRAFARLLTMLFPSVCHSLKFVNHYTDVEQFFTEIVSETVKLREEKKTPAREDFINLLVELKREGDINLQDIITQSFLFFAAGFETSSSTISYFMYEVSQRNDIQWKIKEEIVDVLGKYKGAITYEAINEFTYLNQVIEETLRKYPPVTIMNRECSKPYQVPNTNLILEKGTKVFIPTFAIHWDHDNYPHPHIFDPERFTAENKQKRHACSWLGFGEGPRQCIGLRFAQLQTKIALLTLFKEYNFKLHKATKTPLLFDKAHILSSKGNILIEKRKWCDTNIDAFLKETVRADNEITKDQHLLYQNLHLEDLRMECAKDIQIKYL